MAFPDGAERYEDGAGVQPYGVILGVYPSSSPLFNVELQRSSTASTWAKIAEFGGWNYRGAFQYKDVLPNDNINRSYRARHTQRAYTAGSWTATVTAKPIELPDGDIPTPPLSGKGINVPIYLSSGVTMNVGSVSAAGSITKTLRIPYTEMRPTVAGEPYQIGGGYLHPNSVAATRTYMTAVVLPRGVTLTAYRMRTYQVSTVTDSAQSYLEQGSSTGGNSTMATLISESSLAGAWQTYASTLAQVVGEETYVIKVQLYSSASATDTRLLWHELDYTMPSYDKTI